VVIGSWQGLTLLFQSPLWRWELQETRSVAAPAALARGIPGEVRVLGIWYADPISAGRLSVGGTSGDWLLLNCDPHVYPRSP